VSACKAQKGSMEEKFGMTGEKLQKGQGIPRQATKPKGGLKNSFIPQ